MGPAISRPVAKVRDLVRRPVSALSSVLSSVTRLLYCIHPVLGMAFTMGLLFYLSPSAMMQLAASLGPEAAAFVTAAAQLKEAIDLVTYIDVLTSRPRGVRGALVILAASAGLANSSLSPTQLAEGYQSLFGSGGAFPEAAYALELAKRLDAFARAMSSLHGAQAGGYEKAAAALQAWVLARPDFSPGVADNLNAVSLALLSRTPEHAGDALSHAAMRAAVVLESACHAAHEAASLERQVRFGVQQARLLDALRGAEVPLYCQPLTPPPWRAPPTDPLAAYHAPPSEFSYSDGGASLPPLLTQFPPSLSLLTQSIFSGADARFVIGVRASDAAYATSACRPRQIVAPSTTISGGAMLYYKPQFSSDHLAVYVDVQLRDAVIGVRGTHNVGDLLTDVLAFLGLTEFSERTAEIRRVKESLAALGIKNVLLTGHSLGGTLVTAEGTTAVLPFSSTELAVVDDSGSGFVAEYVVTFNRGVGPVEVVLDTLNEARGVQRNDEISAEHYRTAYDPVSALGIAVRSAPLETYASTVDDKWAHRLAHFIKMADVIMAGR